MRHRRDPSFLGKPPPVLLSFFSPFFFFSLFFFCGLGQAPDCQAKRRAERPRPSLAFPPLYSFFLFLRPGQQHKRSKTHKGDSGQPRGRLVLSSFPPLSFFFQGQRRAGPPLNRDPRTEQCRRGRPRGRPDSTLSPSSLFGPYTKTWLRRGARGSRREGSAVVWWACPFFSPFLLSFLPFFPVLERAKKRRKDTEACPRVLPPPSLPL